jgi:sigma-B regulation protein RsbU (phosphoserine phosphatase)
MALLKIGVKLEEAQRKLNRIHETHSAMMVQPLLLPGARFSVVYKSLNEAGGDIYDVIRISEDLYGYFVGDVSGHDIGTSFITASIKALLRQNCSSIQTPLESMQAINKVLFDLLGDSKYITAAYVVLDRTEQTVTLINMGHPPVLFIPLQGPPYLLEAHGDVLGAFKDAIFEMQIISVSPGDRMIIYTDGLIENDKCGIWSKGLEGLLDYCTNLNTVPLPDLAHTLYNKIYSGSERPRDDVVVMGIEV